MYCAPKLLTHPCHSSTPSASAALPPHDLPPPADHQPLAPSHSSQRNLDQASRCPLQPRSPLCPRSRNRLSRNRDLTPSIASSTRPPGRPGTTNPILTLDPGSSMGSLS